MENGAQFDGNIDDIYKILAQHEKSKKAALAAKEAEEMARKASIKKNKIAKKKKRYKNIAVSLTVVAASLALFFGKIEPAIAREVGQYESYNYAIPYAQQELVDAGYGYFEGEDFYLYENNDYSGLDLTVRGNSEGLATFELYERAIKDAENIKDIDAGKDRYTLSEEDVKEADKFTRKVQIFCESGIYTKEQILEGGGSFCSVMGVNNWDEASNLSSVAITEAVDKAKDGDTSELDRIINDVQNKNLTNTKGGK